MIADSYDDPTNLKLAIRFVNFLDRSNQMIITLVRKNIF